jgi:hypothetical protein
MLTAETAGIAKREVAHIAGPLLLAFGVHPGEARETLLTQLRASRQHDRETLVRTAAIAADTVTGMSLDDREHALSQLAQGETLDSLSPENRASAEAWSEALDVRSGLGRFTAWVVETAFKLPLSGKVGDIQDYVLPDRIGVMTTRSLTPYREEDGESVDYGV